MECVVLAGGMGTRLRSAVPDLPKCLAPVAGRPFLAWLIDDLEEAGFDHVILSLGYRHEVIEEWAAARSGRARIDCVVEHEPLGTGGGVRLALQRAAEPDVFILNGDTYFGVDYAAMREFHRQHGAVATLALKPMRDFDRYGEVTCDPQGRITAFREKQPCASGLINGGVYLLQRGALADLPQKFSLERDFFEPLAGAGPLAGFRSEGYFIDIGARDAADVEKLGIEIGTPITVDRELKDLANGKVTGKALDNRVGVALQIEVLKKVKSPHTIYGVFTVQEETGLKGAKVSAFAINPDCAIATDVTIPGDHPGITKKDASVEMGKGPVLVLVSAAGRGLIADTKLTNWLRKAGDKNKIPYQLQVGDGGNTDASIINLVNAGIPSIPFSIASRYIHSPVEVIDMKDLEDGVKLLVEALKTKPKF